MNEIFSSFIQLEKEPEDEGGKCLKKLRLSGLEARLSESGLTDFFSPFTFLMEGLWGLVYYLNIYGDLKWAYDDLFKFADLSARV